MKYSIKEINETYDFELDKVIEKIKEEKAETVLLQFPDGLKQYATSIVDYLESQIENTNFIIWVGPCWGACDYPVGLEHLDPKIDLTIQFGHNSLMPSYL